MNFANTTYETDRDRCDYGSRAPLPALSRHRTPSIQLDLLVGTAQRGLEILRLTVRDLELACCIGLRETPIPPPKLASYLWPETHEAAAANALKVRLHRLRRRLGDRDAIRCTGLGYALSDSVTTDVHELRAFARRLANSRSVTPADIDLAREAYRRIARAEVPARLSSTVCGDLFAEKVESLRRDFAFRLAAIARTMAHPATVLEIAGELVRIDACDEAAWEILIRTRLSAGDRISALRDYRKYVRSLRDELDLPPAERISAMLAPVTSTPALEPDSASQTPAPAARTPTTKTSGAARRRV